MCTWATGASGQTPWTAPQPRGPVHNPELRRLPPVYASGPSHRIAANNELPASRQYENDLRSSQGKDQFSADEPLRRENLPAPESFDVATDNSANIPAEAINIQPAQHPCYWEPIVFQSLQLDGKPTSIGVGLEQLILAALQHSPRVHGINDNTSIRRTAIVEAEAEFDTRAFMETKMVRRSDPTGTTLDAGVGVSRLRENDWYYSAGLRNKNTLGGKFEIAQRFGLRDSNSLFFTPPNQGNARLTLNYTQPLLNGFGRAYNRSLIVLAQIDTRVAEARTLSELQDYLMEVTDAHWQLYRSRVALAQKDEQIKRAGKIVSDLEGRKELDVRQGHIDRASGVIFWLEKERQRALGKIRNAEARLRALVNSPELKADPTVELIPTVQPNVDQIFVTAKDAMVTALQHRPEMDEAMQEIKAAQVRLKMAKSELLPVLDLVLETYVTGLDGDNDIGDAYLDQFRRGEPGYTAGLMFEVPLGNRAARARHERRKLELAQLSSQFEHAVNLIGAEVEVVVNDVNMSQREVANLTKALAETKAEIRFVESRMQSNIDGGKQPVSSYLEHLLEANERLATIESDYADAQVSYVMSLARLKRATGTLLQYEHISSVGPAGHPAGESIEINAPSGQDGISPALESSAPESAAP